MLVALVESDGTAWGARLDLTEAWQDFEVLLSDLRPTPLALLPRPYPQFLPYLRDTVTDRAGPRPGELDGLQFTTSADLFSGADLEGEHGFEIERVVLHREP